MEPYKKPTGEKYNIGEIFTDKFGTDHAPSDERLLMAGYCKYVTPAEFDPSTHKLGDEIFGPETYTNDVVAISPEHIEQAAAETLEFERSALEAAARAYESSVEHDGLRGSGMVMAIVGASLGLPKCSAAVAWGQTIWAEYQRQKILLLAGEPYTADFSGCGDCPHTMTEIQIETAK